MNMHLGYKKVHPLEKGEIIKQNMRNRVTK